MNKMYKISFLTVLVALVAITGCNKSKLYENKIPEALAHFTKSNAAYFVRDVATDSFIIQVGTTTVSPVDRLVTYNISSPSGAVAGTHYADLSGGAGTVTVRAGEAIAKIKLHGIFAAYATGRKDTLLLSLSEPSVPSAKFDDTLQVVLQRYCDVDLSTFAGSYTNCFDLQAPDPAYGPYGIDVTSFTTLTATTGYLMMSNIWDAGGPDVRVDLDWTDPANFTTSIAAQVLGTYPGYGTMTITGVGKGSFSSCDNTFSLKYKVTVAAGSFGNFETTMAR